jgi:hypothetical protein
MKRAYFGIATVLLSCFAVAQASLLPRSDCADLALGIKTRMTGVAGFVSYPGNRIRLHLFASGPAFKEKRLEESTILMSLDQLVFKRESLEGKSISVLGKLKCLVPPDALLPVLHLENSKLEFLGLEAIEPVPETFNSWKLTRSKQARDLLYKWLKLSQKGKLPELKRLFEPSEIGSSHYFIQRLNWLINESPNAWKHAQFLPSAINVYRDQDDQEWYYVCQSVKQPQFWVGSTPNRLGQLCLQLIEKDGKLFVELSQFDLEYIPKTTVEPQFR